MNWRKVYIVRRSGQGWVIAVDGEWRWTSDTRSEFKVAPRAGGTTGWREVDPAFSESRGARLRSQAQPHPPLSKSEIEETVADVQPSIAATSSTNPALGDALSEFVDAWAAQQMKRTNG